MPGWLIARPGSRFARRAEAKFYARLAGGFLTNVRRTGAAPAGPGTLYVCNHISWLDIPVLGATLGADFIAKSDVGSWPLIGTLSRRTGILLVQRERRGETADQVAMIADRLARGRSLMLFPEGTTSDGTGILPFRSSLFAAASAARMIQPLALAYLTADGGALDAETQRAVGWVGEESLGASVARVTHMALSAEVRLLPAFAADAEPGRKALADRCHAEICEAYAAIRGLAKRPE